MNKGVLNCLESIGKEVKAERVFLLQNDHNSPKVIASWKKTQTGPQKTSSVLSLALHKDGCFYGALSLVDPESSIEDTAGFLKPKIKRKLCVALKPFKQEQALPILFIAESKPMKRLIKKVEKVACSKAPVLLLGESGTGKTEVARLIHEKGPLKDGPFVALQCIAIPETLFESELFGYTKGSFTGATSNKQGLIELAEGGTLFLDEIGDLPSAIQSKLLRVIETGDYYQVGGRKLQHQNVRIICATSKDLKKMTKEELFRPELFYRISAITLRLPPLSRRKQEIPLLASYFLERACFKMGVENKELSRDAEKLLSRMKFPGNVRELINLMESIAALVEEEVIHSSHLADLLEKEILEEDASLNLDQAKHRVEKNLIHEALCRYKSLSEAAYALGIDRRTLWRKKREIKKMIKEKDGQ